MTPPHDQDAPVAPRPELNDPPQPMQQIALGTSVNGNVITITGSGDATVPVGQAATIFKFTLNDTSGANVQFSSLDTKDGTTACPPLGSGNQSTQISGITMHNNQSPRWAQFTDANSNNSANGTLNVSYQWEFTCDSGYTVLPFDPVISNGGRTGPIL
jgi:hypothetical protein